MSGMDEHINADKRRQKEKMRIYTQYSVEKHCAVLLHCRVSGETGWVWLSQSECWDCCLFLMPELCLLTVCTERLQQGNLPPTADCVTAGHQDDKHHTGHVNNTTADLQLASSSIITSLCVHTGTEQGGINSTASKRENTVWKRARRGETNHFDYSYFTFLRGDRILLSWLKTVNFRGAIRWMLLD